MLLRALLASTAVVLIVCPLNCTAQASDTSLRFYEPQDDVDQFVTVSEGNKGSPASGTNVVKSFSVKLAVKPDTANGPNVNNDLRTAQWPGHTQVTLDIHWVHAKKAPWQKMDFLLSSKGCDDPSVTQVETQNHLDGQFEYKWPFAPFADKDAKEKIKDNMKLHMYKNTVVTLGEARCAAIVDSQNKPPKLLASAPIRPPQLEIPQQFHAAIQASIRDKGFSFVLYESLDYNCNAVVQEYYSSAWGHTRLLFDFGNKDPNGRLWRMHAPNTTHPKGVCVSQEMKAEVPFENVDGTHVASSRHFLGLRDATTFLPGNDTAPVFIRGVPTDVYSFDINIKRHAQKFTGGYQTLFYFSKPIWHVADDFGQRKLRRVELSGATTSGNQSRAVYHTYDYLDFQSRIPDTVTFEPTFMLPGGEGCEELGLGCAVDEGRKNDASRGASAAMVTERVQVDVERAATCTTAAFVSSSSHRAAVGSVAALTCLITALTVALVACVCARRRRDKSASAALYAHGVSDVAMDS